jgi:hypothetical protein
MPLCWRISEVKDTLESPDGGPGDNPRGSLEQIDPLPAPPARPGDDAARRRGVALLLALLVGLAGPSGCAPFLANQESESRLIGSYLLRVADTSPESVTGLVTDAVAEELPGTASLPAGYPRLGRVRLAEGSDPGETTERCIPEGPGGHVDCILLGEENEFVRIRYRADPTCAFHHFTVYVLPPWPWTRVNLYTTGRVEIDVIAKPQGGLAEDAFDAVGAALAGLGARAYAP